MVHRTDSPGDSVTVAPPVDTSMALFEPIRSLTQTCRWRRSPGICTSLITSAVPAGYRWGSSETTCVSLTCSTKSLTDGVAAVVVDHVLDHGEAWTHVVVGDRADDVFGEARRHRDRRGTAARTVEAEVAGAGDAGRQVALHLQLVDVECDASDLLQGDVLGGGGAVDLKREGGGLKRAAVVVDNGLDQGQRRGDVVVDDGAHDVGTCSDVDRCAAVEAVRRVARHRDSLSVYVRPGSLMPPGRASDVAGPVAVRVTLPAWRVPPSLLTTLLMSVIVEKGAHTDALGTVWFVVIPAVLPKPPPLAQSPFVCGLTAMVAVTVMVKTWLAPALSCVAGDVTPVLVAEKLKPTGLVETATLVTVTPAPKPNVSFSEYSAGPSPLLATVTLYSMVQRPLRRESGRPRSSCRG